MSDILPAGIDLSFRAYYKIRLASDGTFMNLIFGIEGVMDKPCPLIP